MRPLIIASCLLALAACAQPPPSVSPQLAAAVIASPEVSGGIITADSVASGSVARVAVAKGAE